jgi:hypothetical protein
MVDVEIEIEEGLYQKALMLCKEEGISFDEFVNRAIRWYMEKEDGDSKDEG